MEIVGDFYLLTIVSMKSSENVVPAITSWIAALTNRLPQRQDDTLTHEAEAMQAAMQETVSDILSDHRLRTVSVELERSFWTQRWLILHIIVEDIDDTDMSSVREKLAAWIQKFDPESRIRAIRVWPMNALHMAGALMAAEAVREKNRHRHTTPVSSSLLPQT